MVIDELFAKRGTELFPIDSYDGEIIEEIVVEGNTYHFAKQRDIEGETQVVADNTVDEPIISLGVEGNTFQQTYSGKNLIDVSAKTSGSFSITSRAEGKITVKTIQPDASSYILFEKKYPAGTYTISGIKTGGDYTAIRLLTTVKITGSTWNAHYNSYYSTFIGNLMNEGAMTFTASSEFQIGFNFTRTTGGATSTSFENIMLEKSSTATEYEPYVGGTASPNPDFPQPIHNANDNRLPSEYQEVEYIESKGEQYINIDKPVNNFEAEVATTSTETQYIGCFISATVQRCQIGVSTTRAVYGIGNDDYSGNYGGYDKSIGTGFHKYKITNTKFTMDNVALANYYVTYPTANSGGVLFGRRDTRAITTGLTNTGIMKIKSAKFYNGDTLVFDFVPCYRKVDGVIGMYDLVSNTLYTNDGTGTFLKGENVYEGMSLELSGANLFDIDTVLGNMDTIVPEVPRGWAKQTDGSWYCYNCGLVAGKFLFTNVAKKQGKLTLLVCQKTTSQMVNNQVGLTYNIRYTDGTTEALRPIPNTAYEDFYITTNEDKTVDFIYLSYVRNYAVYIKYIMINWGNPIPYEPYFEPTTIQIPPSVTVGSSTIPLRFAKINSPYGDYIDKIVIDRTKGTVEYHQNTGLYTYTGNESFMQGSYTGSSNYNRYWSYTPSMNISIVTGRGRGYCTHFKWSDYVNMGVVFGLSNTYISFIADNTTFPTVTDFKNWLKTQAENGNPVSVVYPLKENITDITNTDLGQELLALATHKGTNIFTISSEIPVSKTALSYWRQIIPNE
jgi:hypothetical protein